MDDRLQNIFEKLDKMPREQFAREVVGGIGSTYEFSKFVTRGPVNIEKSDWEKIHPKMLALGAPEDIAPSEAYRLAVFIARKTFSL